MTPREWKEFVIGLIDRLESQLSLAAPKTARLRLAEIRECASKATTSKARKLCERRVDKLVESTPYFMGAATRCLGEIVDNGIDTNERIIKHWIQLARAQGRKKAESNLTHMLANFRQSLCKANYKPIKSLPRT